MKKGVMIATLFIVLIAFVGMGRAELVIIKGEIVDISGDMYTIKTESEQGFRGSRETIHVDPKTTEKSGEFAVGTKVQAEIDQNNGHAHWIKVLGGN